jgi:hypothetical protein
VAVEVFPAAHIGRAARDVLRAGTTLALRAAFSRAAHAVASGGELLVLAGDEVAAPWVVGVPGLPWAALAREPQARLVVCSDHPTRLTLAGLTIDLASARLWNSPCPRHVTPPTMLRAALDAAALPRVAPGLAACDAAPLVAELARALSAGAATAVTAAAAPLVGLGRGLTPAGDDLVSGVLGVMALAGRPCHAPPLAGRTTLPGATQIAHAATGGLAEPLHVVIVALLAGEQPPAEALRRTLALGHSSGADLLAGAHLALAALSGRPAR